MRKKKFIIASTGITTQWQSGICSRWAPLEMTQSEVSGFTWCTWVLSFISRLRFCFLIVKSSISWAIITQCSLTRWKVPLTIQYSRITTLSWYTWNHANRLSDEEHVDSVMKITLILFMLTILPYALFSSTLGPQQDRLPNVRTMVHVAPTVDDEWLPKCGRHKEGPDSLQEFCLHRIRHWCCFTCEINWEQCKRDQYKDEQIFSARKVEV